MSQAPDFKITAPLTGKELTATPIIVKLFTEATGHLTNQDISRHLRQNNSELNLTGSRIRKIMNHIRIHKLVKNVLADSKGYYVSDNTKEVRKYVASLDDRIEAITALKNSYEI